AELPVLSDLALYLGDSGGPNTIVRVEPRQQNALPANEGLDKRIAVAQQKLWVQLATSGSRPYLLTRSSSVVIRRSAAFPCEIRRSRKADTTIDTNGNGSLMPCTGKVVFRLPHLMMS